MHVEIPKQLSVHEELLKSKQASLKKKKKEFLEAKASREQLNSQSLGSKRKSTDLPVSQEDAKEIAKKLVKSGKIKLETEIKEKSFKRPVARKDESKKLNTQLSLEAEPGAMMSPNQSRFTKADSSALSPKYQKKEFKFYRNQLSIGQRHGVSLHVKAKNISEESIRDAFSSHASNVNILSIDMKLGYAFVNIESKEMGEMAISSLNGKIVNESQYMVSFARPRKVFENKRSFGLSTQRNNSIEEQSSDSALKNWNQITHSNDTASTTESTRSLVSYENDHDLFNN